MGKKIERRVLPACELRVIDDDDKTPLIVGYAARFNVLSLDLGGFFEKINSGAFKSALRKSDIFALFNHNWDFVLGRKSAKTLKLKEDEHGLYDEIIPPDTQAVRDLMESIKRRDITDQSFGFTVEEDMWEEKKGKMPVRTIIKISELFDVSVVAFGAYPQTDVDVALRSLVEYRDREGQTCVLPAKRIWNVKNKLEFREKGINRRAVALVKPG